MVKKIRSSLYFLLRLFFSSILERPLVLFLKLLPLPSSVLGPPKGLIKDLQGYVRHWEQSQVWSERGKGHWYIPIKEPEFVFFKGPAPDVPGFSRRLMHRFPELFLVHIHQGKLALRDGVVLSPEDRVFDQLMRNWGLRMKDHRIFRKIKLPALQQKNGVFATILTPGGRDNYYHWMIDTLPRIAVLEKAGVQSFQLVIPSPRLPWQAESLTMLGYDEDRWCEFGEEYWQMESLLVPSFVQDSGYAVPWSVQWLRERLSPGTSNSKNRRRLYINRSKAKRRHLVNEGEVIGALEREGFEAVYLEEYPLREQIRLFSEAEFIVAPHGAGLANLIFVPPGCGLLELFSPQYINPCFFSLSSVLSVNYSCLVGQCVSAPSRNLDIAHGQDFNIPVQDVLLALKK